jgi:DNA-binding transcriptional LysR family regulator
MVVRALRAFLALHRRGTVAAAAEEVHLSPAAVSVQLKLLEERLGADLFVRTKRSLSLTSAGQRLVPLAEKMLAVYEEMQALSDPGAVHGKITLGVINSALTGVFPAILQKLKTENARLEIKIVAGTSPLLASQVQAGVLDAAVVTQPPRQVASSLQVHPLYDETFALIQPKGMPYVNLATSVESVPYIALDRSTWTGHDIDAFLAHKGISVRPAMELNTHDAILAAIRHGLGISILPVSRYGSAAQDPALQLIMLPGFQRAVCLVEREVHPHSHLTRKILSAFAALEAGRPSRRRARGSAP